MLADTLEFCFANMADGCVQPLVKCLCDSCCDRCLDQFCPREETQQARAEGDEDESAAAAEPDDAQRHGQEEPLITKQPGYNTFMTATRQADGEEA